MSFDFLNEIVSELINWMEFASPEDLASFAISDGRPDRLKEVVKKIKDINYLNVFGETILFDAILYGDIKCVDILLKYGNKVDVSFQDSCGNTPLIRSVHCFESRIFEYLMKYNPDVDLCDVKKRTALIFAIICRENFPCTGLIEKSRNIDHADICGNTALIYAAYFNKATIARCLLEKGSDTSILNNQSKSALIVASEKGHIDVVKSLVGSSPQIIDHEDQYGFNALMYSAYNGYSDICKTLLSNGADPEYVSKIGYSSLDCAWYGKSKEIYTLLEEKARKSSWPSEGMIYNEIKFMLLSGYMLCIDKLENGFDSLGIIRNRIHMFDGDNIFVFLKHLSKIELQGLFYRSCDNKHSEIALALIDNGLDVNFKYNDGNTPLLISVMNNNSLVAKRLLEKGANILPYNLENCTALDIACKNGSQEIINIFIDYFSNASKKEIEDVINVTSFLGALVLENLYVTKAFFLIASDHNLLKKIANETLLVAAMRNMSSIIDFVVEAGFNVNFSDEDVLRALVVASQKNSFEFVKKILFHAKNYCYQDNSAEDEYKKAVKLACFDAVRYLNNDIALYLIKNEININERNDDGLTLLMNAAMYGNLKMAEELIKLNIEVNAADKDGNTALHFSVLLQDREMSCFLSKQDTLINRQNKYERTALMEAVRLGDVFIISDLLKHGANTVLKDESGRAAVDFTMNKKITELFDNPNIFEKNLETLSFEILNDQRDESLCQAHDRNKFIEDCDRTTYGAHYKYLLEISFIHADQATLELIDFIFENRTKEAIFLIDKIELSLKKQNNAWLVLYYTSRMKNEAILKKLIDSNIDIDVSFFKEFRVTNLFMFMFCNNLESAKFLLKNSAKIDLDCQIIDFLFADLQMNFIDKRQSLEILKSIANEIQDKSELNKFLFIATRNGVEELAIHLVKKGADVEICANHPFNKIISSASQEHH